jgi:hypothetical protein
VACSKRALRNPRLDVRKLDEALALLVTELQQLRSRWALSCPRSGATLR